MTHHQIVAKSSYFFQKSSSVSRRTYFERALHTNSCVAEAAPRGIQVAPGLVIAAELKATERGAKMKGAVRCPASALFACTRRLSLGRELRVCRVETLIGLCVLGRSAPEELT